ncbi:MBOAT family O-acyltransferase [Methylocaldum marinum]
MWLTAASMFFYGYWNPAYLPLLAASISFNYVIGFVLARERDRDRAAFRKFVLTSGVAANLLMLAYYKYAGFLAQAVKDLTGVDLSLAEIVLPLGISFFTFTQIAFLVDVYRGIAREFNFVHYALFVTYFPHLIAGPVLHHKEMMPQFSQKQIYRLDWENLALGATVFVFGLFKKVVLADGIAIYATPVFDAVDQGRMLSSGEAWIGVLAYSAQLYFDFSGYSDMAIGLSRMFGIKLPLNFNSPYKAVNIIDFWRRWHMTLSHFLRDYLYIPLGGSRKGKFRRYLNLMITMLLGGLWHGAGWTFLLWGGLHGLYLVMNHAWHSLRLSRGHDLERSSRLGRICGRTVTFLAVILAWVPFRTESFSSAASLYASMAGIHGNEPRGVFEPLAESSSIAAILNFIPVHISSIFEASLSCAVVLVILFTIPNTQQVMRYFRVALEAVEADRRELLDTTWTPSFKWALVISMMGLWAFLDLNRVSEFLYFQF